MDIGLLNVKNVYDNQDRSRIGVFAVLTLDFSKPLYKELNFIIFN